MAYNTAIYTRLMNEAAFNYEPFRGDIQDHSRYRRSMSYVGTPKFCKNGNANILRATMTTGVSTTSNISTPVDITADCTFENFVFPELIGSAFSIYTPVLFRTAGSGGFVIYYYLGANILDYYNAAGGEYKYSITSGYQQYCPRHVIYRTTAGFTTCNYLYNGSLVYPTITSGGGTLANGPDQKLYILTSTMIFRCWPRYLTNEEIYCLAQAASENLGLGTR